MNGTYNDIMVKYCNESPNKTNKICNCLYKEQRTKNKE